jgi:dipeptidyl aminopeptidase/acylaminoacyl peptidase
LEHGAKKKTFTSGVVYDELFVRHWDRYIEPERFSQLFSVKIMIDGSRITLNGPTINLLKGTRLQTPVPPNGGMEDYDISPEGDEIAFVARVPDRSQAWNTNTDIYLVPTDGSAAPMPISSFNLGYDMHPKYSLDGSFIAWLQMPTPQYEADKNRIALYPRSFAGSKATRFLDDEEWDRSPQSITWVSDGLVITAEEIGRLKLFHVSLDGLVLPIVEDGHNSQVQYVPNLGLVFVKNSMAVPSEIYTFGDKEKRVQKRTTLAETLVANVELMEPTVRSF